MDHMSPFWPGGMIPTMLPVIIGRTRKKRRRRWRRRRKKKELS
jgi:hypothetical protein